MIKFYGYKRCGTARKGEKFLTENGIDYEFIDITVNPPAEEELKKIIELSGKEIKKFFNTSGVAYKEGDYKTKIKTMSDEEKIKELSSNGKLIKRPIVFDGKKATVGYNEEEFSTVWKS